MYPRTNKKHVQKTFTKSEKPSPGS
jgi:hypothetical protein